MIAPQKLFTAAQLQLVNELLLPMTKCSSWQNTLQVVFSESYKLMGVFYSSLSSFKSKGTDEREKSLYPIKNSRKESLFIILGECIILMAFIAFVYEFAYPEKSICSFYTTKLDCLDDVSLFDSEHTLCKWDIYSMTCSYNHPQPTGWRFLVIVQVNLLSQQRLLDLMLLVAILLKKNFCPNGPKISKT